MRPGPLLCALTALGLAAGAAAQPSVSREEAHAPPHEGAPGSASRSVGRPSSGRLLGGVRLLASPTLRLRNPRGSHYGTAELVGLLEDAARHVAATFPGSRLSVGDLSREGGGRIRPHRSHRAGRDADVGFYVLDEEGGLAYPDRFPRMGRDGTGTVRGRTYRFDVARNWALVSRLVTSERAPVQYLFVWRSLSERLIEHAQAIGAPPEVVARARHVMHQPSRGAPHRTHFHVRVYCADDDRPRCIDEAPFWEWYPR